MRARPVPTLPVVCLAIHLMATAALAAKIDATPGRQYPITKQHGPWMIMVASLSQTPAERRQDGISPEEAADELVYALRKRGIPAYVFRLNGVDEPLQTTTRSGRPASGLIHAQKESVSVLAGNYPTLNDTVAQRTLNFVKKLTLKDLNLKSWEQYGVFRPTPGQPGPFSGAFLTVNPTLTQEELARTKRDPLLLKLNTGSEYSITQNRGKFTLVVASFKGRSEALVGENSFRKALDSFQVTDTLDDAGERAWKVTRLLREGLFNGSQKGRTFDAFVFHDRYQSLVTVGEFDSPDDPRIRQYAELFGAKTQTGPNGKQFTAGESILIPGEPVETIVFDPVPRLIEVPRLR